MHTPLGRIAMLAAATMLLAGCGSAQGTTNASDIPITPQAPATSEPEESAPTSPSEIPEEGATLVEPGFMPVIIPGSDIPPVTVTGDYPIGKKKADEVYEWVAALAWYSINDGELQQGIDGRENIIRRLLPYLTDEATQRVLTAVRTWADGPTPYDPQTITTTITDPMFFLITPPGYGLGEYENDPVHSDVKILNPRIERITNAGTTARYRVDFDMTAAVYFRPYQKACEQVRPESCGELFYVGMSYPRSWTIVATGNEDAPYRLDTWKTGTPTYGYLTQLSD